MTPFITQDVTPFINYQYTYDKMDNITSKATEHGNYGYGYDDLYRLNMVDNPEIVSLSDEAFTYDNVGNRLTAVDTTGTWTYNQNNELGGYDDVSYEYDVNGNTIKKVAAGITTSYAYNVEDRLAEVWDGEAGTGTLVATYYYDPFGRRLWKDVGGTRTNFHYSDEGLIGEYDASGSELKTYGYKPGSTWTTDPLFMKVGSQYYFYQNDHLGTPQKLTATSGAVAWSAKYESFGEATVDPASTVTSNLRFAGQYYDQETGLHYNWHRYYDPETGRYLRADPIGLAGIDKNIYGFVLNNPILFLDPFGLDTWSGAGVEVGGFLGFGGVSTMYGSLKNWDTGEECDIEVVCYKLGIGLGGGVTAQSLWILGGPTSGSDLAGASVGGSVEGGIGGYVSGSPAGGVGASKDGSGGHAAGLSGGAGLGIGGAMYGEHCTTRVISCKNNNCGI